LARRLRHRAPDRCYPALDERVAARFVRLRSGLRVRAVECGPRGGTPVVLLPGWGVSAFTYRHQLPALGAAGYRATAIDLKGHGFSDKPTGAGEYTFNAMLLHAEEVIDAIAPSPAIVVAQSMAGPLGIELARANERVAALVLVSPVGFGVVPFIGLAQVVMPQLLDEIARHLVPRWAVRAALRLVFGESAQLTEDTVDEYWAPAQFPDFARALRALVQDFAWSPLREEELAGLRDRTLVVLGGRERLMRGARERAERLFAPSVVVIPDAGHAVNEERPELVNAAILEFLGRPPV
jgi:non-heme chloroperoxidase